MNQFDPTTLSMRVNRARAVGVTPAELRSDLYEHSLHGVVTPRYCKVDPLDARIGEAIALMGTSNALGGWASLYVQGNHWFDGMGPDGDLDVPIHCLTGSQLRVRPGIRPTEGRMHAEEIVQLEHYAAATLARATYDEMRVARGFREAVVVLDMATSSTSLEAPIPIEAVLRVVESHHKTRGIVQVRRALALGNSRSASPWETRTRLMATLDADITDLRVNCPVFDLRGKILGIADLIDLRTGLIIESDGGGHREAEQHASDNVREEKFERAGAVVCRVASLDHQDRWTTVGRMRSAYRDAMRSSQRLWTVKQPDWWRTWPPARRWD